MGPDDGGDYHLFGIDYNFGYEPSKPASGEPNAPGTFAAADGIPLYFADARCTDEMAKTSDGPLETLHGDAQTYDYNNRFETWLMYRPPGDGSQFVPLRSFNWALEGKLDWDGTQWVLTHRAPCPAHRSTSTTRPSLGGIGLWRRSRSCSGKKMRTPSLKSTLLLALLGAALGARAQLTGPEAHARGLRDPNYIAFSKADAVASKLVVRARARLRERKLDEARRLAAEAVLTLDAFPNAALYAHDVLAEVDLLQGQPGLALEELGGVSPLLPREMNAARQATFISDRGALTRAVALVRLGGLPAARAILEDLAPELRRYMHDSRLPMDGSDAPAALEATADLLRSGPGSASDSPETLEDLREAVRLTPNSLVAHFLLSMRLTLGLTMDPHALDEALVEANRAAALAGEREAKFTGMNVDMVRRAIRRRDAKSGG